MDLRPLEHDDIDSYVRLRREALEDAPFAFGASPSQDRLSDPAFIEAALQDPSQTTLCAFDPELVGVVSVVWERRLKELHKAHIYAMYVAPGTRGRGVGRKLMETAIELARSESGTSQLHLEVSDSATQARALYESLGFVVWGVEPHALKIGDRSVSQHHMVLEL